MDVQGVTTLSCLDRAVEVTRAVLGPPLELQYIHVPILLELQDSRVKAGDTFMWAWNRVSLHISQFKYFICVVKSDSFGQFFWQSLFFLILQVSGIFRRSTQTELSIHEKETHTSMNVQLHEWETRQHHSEEWDNTVQNEHSYWGMVTDAIWVQFQWLQMPNALERSWTMRHIFTS